MVDQKWSMDSGRWFGGLVFGLLALSLVAGAAKAGQERPHSQGQRVYVPAYSHIQYGDGRNYLNLTVTLSVRNTDPAQTIEVRSVEYYDEQGKRVRKYLQEPRVLGPLGSADFLVKESDVTGGLSASFLVEWRAGQSVNPPVIHTVMIGAAGAQGVSFIGRGKVIEELEGPSAPTLE